MLVSGLMEGESWAPRPSHRSGEGGRVSSASLAQHGLQQFQLGAGEERKLPGSGERVQKSGWLRGLLNLPATMGRETRQHKNKLGNQEAPIQTDCARLPESS